MEHINYRHWKTVVWLLMPSVILHELTHGWIAQRWADKVRVDWSEPNIWTYWPQEPPVAGYLAAFLAPMIIGYAVTAGVALAAVGGLLPSLPLWAMIWLGGNWLYYSFPTRSDLGAIGDVLDARAT